MIKTTVGKTKYSNLDTSYFPDAWKEYQEQTVKIMKIGESNDPHLVLGLSRADAAFSELSGLGEKPTWRLES